MIRPVGPETDARTVIQVQPSSFLLTFRDPQAFFTPDAFNPFVIYVPAFRFEQSRYPLIPVPSILQRQASRVLAQQLFVIRFFLLIALNRTDHTERLARPAL